MIAEKALVSTHESRWNGLGWKFHTGSFAQQGRSDIGKMPVKEQITAYIKRCIDIKAVKTAFGEKVLDPPRETMNQ